MTKVGYMALDQYGNTFHLGDVKSPRIALLNVIGGTKATPMYRDTKDGKTYRAGWIVNGHWCDVYEVHKME